MEVERHKPRTGEVWKHFKGTLYRIICIARHSENRKRLVIYRSLYGEEDVCARPYKMFMSKVDTMKYPESKQEYRFEYVREH